MCVRNCTCQIHLNILLLLLCFAVCRAEDLSVAWTGGCVVRGARAHAVLPAAHGVLVRVEAMSRDCPRGGGLEPAVRACSVGAGSLCLALFVLKRSRNR